jgi:hypothetical protein
MEVRREDQEKINRFSSLHQKETALEDELRAKIVSFARATLCSDISTNPTHRRRRKTLRKFHQNSNLSTRTKKFRKSTGRV